MIDPSPATAGASRACAPAGSQASPGVVRSCAACRARVEASHLLRFVFRPATESSGAEPAKTATTRERVDAISLDLGRRLGGRGLNVGPSPLCVHRAVKRGAFQRLWKVSLSSEDAEVLCARIGITVRERLAHYMRSAFARGGLVAVDGIEAVVPSEARVLWEHEAFAAVTAGIPPTRASTPRIAAKIKALTSVASEFTFTRVGGIKRRPEAAEACEALERCGGQVVREAGKSGGSVRAGRPARTHETTGGAGANHSGPDGRNG